MKIIINFAAQNTVDVAQLVRALDCGSRGRRFEPGLLPFIGLIVKNDFQPFFIPF